MRIREAVSRDMRLIMQRSVETVWKDIPDDEKEGVDYSKWMKTSVDFIEPVLSDRMNKILVAEDEDASFAGYVVVGETKNMFSPTGYGFVYDVFVEERFRRQGIGSKLIEAAEDFCKSRGLGTLKLEVATNNPVALELYEKTGFSPERFFLGKKVQK